MSITTPSGEVKTQECLAGADIVVQAAAVWILLGPCAQVGDEVTKDEPITTNPNVGGFGQDPVGVGSTGSDRRRVAGREGVHPARHEPSLCLLRLRLLLLHRPAQLRVEEVARSASLKTQQQLYN